MGIYTGKIKVVCVSMQCFPVEPITLEALACGIYDPYANDYHDPEPIEIISHAEWCIRRSKLLCGDRRVL